MAMDSLKSILSKSRSKWRSLPVASRVAVVVALGMSVFSVAWLMIPSSPQLHPMFNSRQFTQSELNSMTQVFANNGLDKWEIKDGCMCVPLAERANYIAALSGTFEPNATTSSVESVLQDNSIWDSPSTRNLRLQNAREKDLARVIALMPDIDEARVNIDQHDDRRFGSKNKMTALVAVKPAPSHPLESERVLAIREIVAAGYAGLDHQNITVIDLETGQVSGTTGALHTKASRSARLKRHETQWQNKLEQLLAAIPGIRIQVSFQAHRANNTATSTATDEEPFAGYDIIARSSISVPTTFFDRLLAQQSSMAAATQLSASEKTAKLEQIETKVITNIKQLTSDLQPHLPGADSVNSKVNVAAVSVAHLNPATDNTEFANSSFHPMFALVLLGLTALALTFAGIHKRRDSQINSSAFTLDDPGMAGDVTSESDHQSESEDIESHAATRQTIADESASTDSTDSEPCDNASVKSTHRDGSKPVGDNHQELITRLGNLPAAAVAEILQREQVSTIAVILSELNEHDAGPIWACLPTDMRDLVIQAIRVGVDSDDQVFDTIASVIITQLESNEDDSSDLADRISNAGQATFAHRMPQEKMDSGINLLSTRHNREVTTQSKELAGDVPDTTTSLTSIDDLMACPEDVLRQSLEHCDTATIATALFGTTVQLQQRVLQVLGQQRSLAVEGELLNPSPVRLGDIDLCRQRILRHDAA